MGTEGKIQGCVSTCTIKHTLLSLNCKESITNAEILAKQIRTVDGGTHINHFQVQSQSKKTPYDPWFGTGNTMPKCSWLGQVRSSMQAIFAAFQHYPQWQLEAFPEKYRENPNLKLDLGKVVSANFIYIQCGNLTALKNWTVPLPCYWMTFRLTR